MKRCPRCSALTARSDRFCPACGAAFAVEPATPATTPIGASPGATSALAEPTTDGNARFLPGAVLAGRYRLVALLGRGGMGEVYRAEDLRLGQTVALKFLPDALARDAAGREQFYAELRIGRQVSHPNVCRLYDLVEVEQHACLSMQFVDGEDLASLLRRLGRLPPEKALEIARDVCAGLAAAHAQGVIHRDLKPGNVMIDGRGRALITDFGIAALADRVEGEPFAGTPAYMAPELLNGEPASVRSDLYALGLLLVEAFTGQRLFDAGSLLELKQRRLATVPSLTRFSAEIPAEFLAQLQACLQPDPAQRPGSAQTLLAALPGGDPLQRALAAGETPTPAMVAAASAVGDLAPRAAWTLLLAALLGLAWVLWLQPRTSMLGLLDPDKPPEVLQEAARQWLHQAGRSAPANDHAAGYFIDQAYVNHLLQRDPPPWSRLKHEQPGPLQFYYRESPRPLAAQRVRAFMTGPAEVGRVMRDDPNPLEPGMAEVVLDLRGRLLALQVVPTTTLPPPAEGGVDWSSWLAATGLDPTQLQVQTPTHSAPVDNDARFAWAGSYPGQPDIPVRVEAASLRGRPVWLQVLGPWPSAQTEAPTPSYVPYLLVAILLFGIGMYAVIIGLVARNLRLRRGDSRGAFRLALVVFLAAVAGLLLRSDHAGSLRGEMGFLVNIVGQAFYFAAVIWVSYLAMEPFARRTWPHLLISWSRLLAGRWRDPMVGRDVLYGTLGGIAISALAHSEVYWATSLGLAERPPLALAFTPLNGARHLAFLWANQLYFCVEIALCALFLRFIAARLWRWDGLSWPLMVLLFAFPVLFFLFPVTGFSGLIPLMLLPLTLVWLGLLWRVGLLSAVLALWVAYVLQCSPLTLEGGRWFSGLSLSAVLVLLALLGFGFVGALAGKPWFGRRLIEPDSG